VKVVHHHGENGLNGINVQKCKKADDPNQGFGGLNAVAQEKQTKSGGGHTKILGAAEGAWPEEPSIATPVWVPAKNQSKAVRQLLTALTSMAPRCAIRKTINETPSTQ
jgi:hypothetical protein